MISVQMHVFKSVLKNLKKGHGTNASANFVFPIGSGAQNIFPQPTIGIRAWLLCVCTYDCGHCCIIES